jgi:hypothetical protein
LSFFFPLCLVLRPERISPSFSSFLAIDFRRLGLFVPELLSRRGLDEERKRKKERKQERKKESSIAATLSVVAGILMRSCSSFDAAMSFDGVSIMTRVSSSSSSSCCFERRNYFLSFSWACFLLLQGLLLQ